MICAFFQRTTAGRGHSFPIPCLQPATDALPTLALARYPVAVSPVDLAKPPAFLSLFTVPLLLPALAVCAAVLLLLARSSVLRSSSCLSP